MLLTSLCYIEKDGNYLMLHRTKKKNDLNEGKWLGIGGKFEKDESPEECILREAEEETGLILHHPQLRCIVTYVSAGHDTEYMHVFTAEDFTGTLKTCSEGELSWIAKDKILELNLWEGDRYFLERIARPGPFFTLKCCYEGDRLVQHQIFTYGTEADDPQPQKTKTTE